MGGKGQGLKEALPRPTSKVLPAWSLGINLWKGGPLNEEKEGKGERSSREREREERRDRAQGKGAGGWKKMRRDGEG